MLVLQKLTVFFPVPTSLLVAYTKHEVSVEKPKTERKFNRKIHAFNLST